MKRIAVAGATGLIGTGLVKKLSDKGYETVIVSSSPEKARQKFPFAKGFFRWGELMPSSLEGCDAVINLAGAPVAGQKWNEEYKKLLISSRVDTTRELYRAVEGMAKKPEAFICSSAVGYYGNGGESELDESGPKGDGFLSDLCEMWEAEASAFTGLGLRVASIRTGIVLSPEDGALKKMLLPFKLGIGGPLGNGRQWFPWLHIDDIVNIYLYAIENNISGAFNAAAPEPVRMKQFASALGKTLHRPSLFPVPAFVLEIIMGEAGSVVLEGQHAIPKALLASGFIFKFTKIEDCLKDLFKK